MTDKEKIMNLTEREKKVIKDILLNAKTKEEELLEYGYSRDELSKIKYGEEWRTIYDRIEERKTIEDGLNVIRKVFGSNWKEKYDYKETRIYGRYHLSMLLNEKEWDKLLDKFQKRR